MAANSQSVETLEARYQQRLEQEVARLREQSRAAVEEFKRSFPPPSDAQIERLLYPELAEYAVELGGRRCILRELPALIEKKFLRLVEQKLPALVAEILSFDERLGDNATQAFAQVLARAATALDLVAEACVLVLDPAGEAGLTREFVQQHASTARQLRILQAQLLLNGARDFLLRLFPGLREPSATEAPATGALKAPATHTSQPQSVGSNSSGIPPRPSPADLP
jgi:hypothetical protein